MSANLQWKSCTNLLYGTAILILNHVMYQMSGKYFVQ